MNNMMVRRRWGSSVTFGRELFPGWWNGRGLTIREVKKNIFDLSVKSRSGESRLSGESWGLGGVRGGENCWGEDDDVEGSF